MVTAKKRIRVGELSVTDALDHPDVQPMRVEDVLTAQFRIGPRKARFILMDANLPPTTMRRRVRELTLRQKSALARAAG
jgi:hypothetical protein